MTNLIKWENATNDLAFEFKDKYFGKDCTDIWWIGNETGGVLTINDYYFNLDRIVEAMRYKATKKKLFGYYDLEIKAGYKKSNKSITEIIGINFRNYLKK